MRQFAKLLFHHPTDQVLTSAFWCRGSVPACASSRPSCAANNQTTTRHRCQRSGSTPHEANTMFHTPSDAHPPCWYPADSLHTSLATQTARPTTAQKHITSPRKTPAAPVPLNAHGTHPAKTRPLATAFTTPKIERTLKSPERRSPVPASTPRDFLPWRFSAAGRLSA